MSNAIFAELKKRLTCPIHRTDLSYTPPCLNGEGAPLPDGEIKCPAGCRWEIRGGIPRFVKGDNYAASFGLQWRSYPKTELDSHTGRSYTRERLERCLGSSLDALRGKVVLECGSGAGRFTELLIPNCGALVCADLSLAVEANLNNCRHLGSYLILQADINKSPLPLHYFDVVICLGVVQHTPCPETTIRSLANFVKPGGSLVIDHYTNSPLGYLDMMYPLRSGLKRLDPQLALRLTKLLTAFCDPIRRQTSKNRSLDRIARRIFPTACYYSKYPELDRRVLYEWHELDTFDMLTDWYKHLRTPDQIRAFLKSLGLQVDLCEFGGNGVEARARVPNVGKS